MEEYLLAVENMNTSLQKLKNVLQFLGVRVETESEIREYSYDPHKLMILPKFIDSFANAAYSPLMVGEEADEFAMAIKKKVAEWVQSRMQNNFRFVHRLTSVCK